MNVALILRKNLKAIFLLALLFTAIWLTLSLTKKRQDIRPKAEAGTGPGNLILSAGTYTTTVGATFDVLVSIQVTDETLSASAADFVLLEKDRTFVLFELPGGQKRSSFQIPEKEGGIYTLCFSPNGLLLALLSGNSSVMVFEVATGKKLWERLDNNPLPGNLAFCDNSQTLVVGKGIPNYSGEFLAKKEIAWAFLSWEFFEANSGNLLLEPYFRGYGGHPILDILPTELVVVAKPVSESRYFHWLRNWLGIPAKDWSLAVFDPATGQSQGQLYCDEQHSFCARSGDGRTLVTEADGGYDVWDLPLRPALHWVLGPPWALAALWLLWEWRWRSRRRKIKPA